MPMSPLDRKIALLRRKVPQAAIARALGVSDESVSGVMTGRSRSARIEQAIAAAIGRPADEVFPSRETAAAA